MKKSYYLLCREHNKESLLLIDQHIFSAVNIYNGVKP